MTLSRCATSKLGASSAKQSFPGKEGPLQGDHINCWASLERKFDGTPETK